MNVERIIAGVFAGVGGLVLIWKGIETGNHAVTASGTTILGTMLGFFVGESNGMKRAQNK